MKEILKTYEPKEIESKLIKFWEDNKFYSPDNSSSKPKFSVVIPPPNVTGNLTIGHILNNTIQDIYVRWKRMAGYNVLWLPGTDHAGISTQTRVEKVLREENHTRHDLGRENFIQLVWKWKEEYHRNIKSQLIRMGASVDWSRERFTLDEGLSKAVRKVFVDLYKKGLIYKGKRIINWDPEYQTALSDEEVVYKERKDKLYYVKYPILNEDSKGTLKYLIIATTRPETMLGDTAVAVNPEDKRYTEIIGKKVILPLVEKAIPVIADNYVDMEFGTGALKITPAHDPNDYEIGQKYGLDSVQVIDQLGKMNENALTFKGLDRFEARKIIVKKLEENGLIEKIDDYVHSVGYSERGGVMVEPYLSDQWFVSMKTLAEPALNSVLTDKISFHPDRWIKVYENWMNNIRDWCISRQLWWGHQIPVWYNKHTGEKYCEIEDPKDIENWEQDSDVLDTWFSSWLWPFSTMGWPDDTEDLKKFFPTDLLSTAPDIIFFWVARMIMASIEFTGKIPFTDVYFHNIIRDEKGRKMSKSLGNSPDVFDVIDKYGTDALRFTLVYLSPQGVDVWFSEDKCELGRNFANKIWNASRFLMMKKEQIEKDSQGSSEKVDYEHDLFDKWIDSRLNTTIDLYINALGEYKINEASKALHEFIWGDFCDWYIELIKIKTLEKPDEASGLINKALDVFDKTIRLLHPVMPFITEELWSSIYDRKENESISHADFPELKKAIIDAEIENEVKEMQDIVTNIRNLRAEINLSPAKKCNIILKCEDESSKKILNEISAYIKNLGKIETLEIHTKKEFEKLIKFKSISSVVNDVQVYMKVEGLIDIEQEKNRIEKEIKRTGEYLSSIEKKLSNENFIKKASDEVVENEKKKRDESKSKLEKLNEHLHSITS